LFNSQTFKLSTDVSAKHKFALVPFKEEDKIYMYGVLVGRASKPIALGESITTQNMYHASSDFVLGQRKLDWQKPDLSNFEGKTFNCFHRADGSVGT
jgi:altronate hydrolase